VWCRNSARRHGALSRDERLLEAARVRAAARPPTRNVAALDRYVSGFTRRYRPMAGRGGRRRSSLVSRWSAVGGRFVEVSREHRRPRVTRAHAEERRGRGGGKAEAPAVAQ